MFLYESLSGVIGAIVLIWIARRFAGRLRTGDLLLVFFIWYGSVRFAVETLKADNWTFFGIPTAMLISAVAVVGALGILVLRHRGRPPVGLDPPASEGAST
jgi:phosphatidylglycerol:prolipoprotein diacylglycerol transferase